MKVAVILGLFALVCFIGYLIARAALAAEDAGTVIGDPATEPADVSDDTKSTDVVTSSDSSLYVASDRAPWTAPASDPVSFPVTVSAPVASVPSVPVARSETPAT
jgi:hypothetical protein